MARKKNIKKTDLIKFFMDYYLENSETPKSVYQFAKLNNFDEKDFYTHYGSLEGLEKDIFQNFFDQTISLLSKSEEFEAFDPQNKLLSFYYTFFEILGANRSYVLLSLKSSKNPMESMKVLTPIKKSFIEFIDSIEIKTMDLKNEKLEKFKQNSLEQTSWSQLLITIKFWLEDDSPSFEKTDLFIEKSIKAGFDLLDTTPLKSLVDLGKFLYHEKISMN